MPDEKQKRCRKALFVSERFKIRPKAASVFFSPHKNRHKLKWKIKESEQNSLALLLLALSPASHLTRHPRFYLSSATSLVAFRSNFGEGHLIPCRWPSYIDFLLLWVKQQTAQRGIDHLLRHLSHGRSFEPFKAFCCSAAHTLPLVAWWSSQCQGWKWRCPVQDWYSRQWTWSAGGGCVWPFEEHQMSRQAL